MLFGGNKTIFRLKIAAINSHLIRKKLPQYLHVRTYNLIGSPTERKSWTSVYYCEGIDWPD